MYIKSNLHPKRRSDREVLNVECVLTELSIKGNKYLYGTFYRPPTRQYRCGMILSTLLNLLLILTLKILLLHVISMQIYSFLTLSLQDSLKFCEHLTRLKTHFTQHSSSLVDVIIISNSCILSRTYAGEYFLGQYLRYHCPIYGLLN